MNLCKITGMQVTASKTSLLINCARPFDPEVEREPQESTIEMRYGSALHEACEVSRKTDFASLAAEWELPPECAKELKAHTIRTLACLKSWLQGGNPWGETFRVVSRETHRATHIKTLVTRECDFDAETHTYDLQPGEFGGTDDLVVESDNRRIVVDYKSGDWGEFHIPSELPQMMTLALQTEADAVAILHSPREGVPVMYCDEISTEDKWRFHRELRRAWGRIGDGSLRPGKWCARCPARESCPAKDGELLKRAGAMIQLAVSKDALQAPVDKGQFHMFLQELSRLEKRAKEVLRADVKGGEIIVRPDGKVLVLKSKTQESLSKSSIVAALGKQKGEALIKKLRKQGCVKESTHDELRAVEEGK